MARAKHFSTRPSSRSKKRLQWNQSSQTQAGEASTSATPSRLTTGSKQAASPGGTNAAKGTGRRRRFKPGTVALREIRKLQKSCKLILPFAPFVRLVKEITNFYSRDVSRWTGEALVAMQEATECYMQELFEDAYLCTIHAKRVTLSEVFLDSLADNSAKGFTACKANWGAKDAMKNAKANHVFVLE